MFCVFAPFCAEDLNLLHQAGKVIKGQNSGLAFTLSSQTVTVSVVSVTCVVHVTGVVPVTCVVHVMGVVPVTCVVHVTGVVPVTCVFPVMGVVLVMGVVPVMGDK